MKPEKTMSIIPKEEIDKQKQELEKLIDDMYELNRILSLKFIGMREKVSQEEIEIINLEIGKWIKRIREIIKE